MDELVSSGVVAESVQKAESIAASTPRKPATPDASRGHGDAAPRHVVIAELSSPALEVPSPSNQGDGVALPPGCPRSGEPGDGMTPPAPERRRGKASTVSFEDCYPPQREDEVRLRRRQRERQYQGELLRQMEEKRALRQERRREDIRADLLRLDTQERLDQYRQRLREEQQDQLRTQLKAQLDSEDQLEQRRGEGAQQLRQLQREQLRSRQLQPEQLQSQGEVDRLCERLEDQHISEPAQLQHPSAQHAVPVTPTRGPEAGDTGRSSSGHLEANTDDPVDIASGVVDKVQLDDRRPWNHFKLLQRELTRRRRERAALEAAREAAAARQEAGAAREQKDLQYRRYMDRRLRARRGYEPQGDLGAQRDDEEARRWAARQKHDFLQQRVDRDAKLADWRTAKDKQEQEQRARLAEARRAAGEDAALRQRRADSCFTRWLNTIHHRKLMEQAGPVGATGATTYNTFFSAPWNKILGNRRRKSSAV